MHVELRRAVAVEAAPVLFTGILAIVADGIGLVRLVERFKPEQVDAPIQEAADGGLPVCLHVVVAGFGVAGVCATSAWPASFWEDFCQSRMFDGDGKGLPPFMKCTLSRLPVTSCTCPRAWAMSSKYVFVALEMSWYCQYEKPFARLNSNNQSNSL